MKSNMLRCAVVSVVTAVSLAAGPVAAQAAPSAPIADRTNSQTVAAAAGWQIYSYFTSLPSCLSAGITIGALPVVLNWECRYVNINCLKKYGLYVILDGTDFVAAAREPELAPAVAVPASCGD
jgi:hypothetical protein